MLSPKTTSKDSWKNLKLPRTPLHGNSPHSRVFSTTRLSSFSPSRVSTPTCRSPSPSSARPPRSLPELKPIAGISLQSLQKIYQSRCKDLKILPNQIQEFRFYKSCEKTLKNRKFDLKEQQLGQHSGQIIGEILQFSSEFNGLSLSNNHLGDQGVNLLSELICKNQNLIWIDLSSNDLTAAGIKSVFDCFVASEYLVFLDLSSYNGINRNKFGTVAGESLENFVKTSLVLQVLIMNEVNLTDFGLEKLSNGLAANKSLLKLSLVNNYLTHKPFKEFCRALHESQIIELSLADNKISDQGAKVLGSYLASNDFLCKISKLDLCKNEISHIGASELLDINRYNPNLTHLNFDNNPVGPRLGHSLHFFLLSNHALKTLSLNSCNLKSEGVSHLSLGLSKNKCLLTLNLSNNSIEDISILCESLCENNVLLTLELSSNFIKDGELLAKTLKVNTNLQVLSIKENRIKEEDGPGLVESIKFSQKLTKCLVEGNYFNVWTMEELKLVLMKNEGLATRAKSPKLIEKVKKLQIQGITTEEIQAKLMKKQAEMEKNLKKIQKLKEILSSLKNNKDPKLDELKSEQEQAKIKRLELNTELESVLREFRKYLKLEEQARKEKTEKVAEIDIKVKELEIISET